MGLAAWIYVLVMLALLAAVGWAAVAAISTRSWLGVFVGVLLAVAAMYLPFFLGYGWILGVAAAVAGAVVAGVRRFPRVGWGIRAVQLVLVLALAAAPVGTLTWSSINAEERVGRCEGDLAVRTIDGYYAEQRRYPADLHEIALSSDRYGYSSCELLGRGNWMYRHDAAGYTFGYWTDWTVAQDVCLHGSGAPGWACAFNTWGPFLPKERD